MFIIRVWGGLQRRIERYRRWFSHSGYFLHTVLMSPAPAHCNTWDRHCNTCEKKIVNPLHMSWANEHSLARFTSSFPVATRSEKRAKSIQALLLLLIRSWAGKAEQRREEAWSINLLISPVGSFLLTTICFTWRNLAVLHDQTKTSNFNVQKLEWHWFRESEPSPNL